MTIRAKKHAITTDIEKFEKRDKRIHKSVGISPYHIRRRAKVRREGKKYRVAEVESDCIHLVDENGNKLCINAYIER